MCYIFVISFLFCLISPILLQDLNPIYEPEKADMHDGGIREVRIGVGDEGCYQCYLYIAIEDPEGMWCGFFSDGVDDNNNANYVSHPENSIMTFTDSQLSFCDGWISDHSPTDDFWTIRIEYHTLNTPFDKLRLSDAHVYFYTDEGTHGLSCSINETFGPPDMGRFTCHWF